MDSDNIIGTLRLELSLPPSRAGDNPSRHIDALVDDAVLPVIEKVAEEYGVRDIDIDSMDLDLGEVSEDDLPTALERELRARLDAYAAPEPLPFTAEEESVFQPVLQIGGSPVQEVSRLKEYLETSSVPWDRLPSEFDPIDLLRPLLTDKQTVESFVGALDATAAARLVMLLECATAVDRQLPENETIPLSAEGASPEKSTVDGKATDEPRPVTPVLEALRASALERVRALDPDLAARLAISRERWLSYLSSRSAQSGLKHLTTAPGTDSSRKPAASIKNESAAGPARAVGMDAPGTAQHKVQEGETHKDSDTDGRPPVPSGLMKVSLPEEKDLKSGHHLQDIGDEEHQNDRGEDAVSSYHSPDKVQSFPGEPRQGISEAGTPSAAEPVETAEMAPSAYSPPEVEAPGEIAEEPRSAIPMDGQPTENDDVSIVFQDRRERANSSFSESSWSEEAHETLRIPLSDAGLVLIHPFIPRFLSNLDLTDEKGRFRSGIARVHAVHLLREITGFDTPHFDHNLLLEKVLCGLHPDSLLPPDWESDDREKAEIRNLLDAVRSYWPPLSGSSIHALQQAFLQRSGSVEPLEDSYLIRVESSAMDILLDDLPWENSIIILPWLENPIIIEWQR